MMLGIDELKTAAIAAIDQRRGWLIEIAESVLRNPEVGFQEAKTSRLVADAFSQIGIPYRDEIAITGIKAVLSGGRPGPAVAILGEMDALRVPDHRYSDPSTGVAHACGHNCQIGMILGVALGLSVPEVRDALDGQVIFMAVPAEEFIDIEERLRIRENGQIDLLSGKQEFIRLGEFDEVDIAMMVHTSATSEHSKFSLGGTSNGHLVKQVEFIGKSAHSGSAPHQGVNALQAAMVGMNALNTQRETFAESDTVRLHGIITDGGRSVNSVPSSVRYEGRVRGATSESIADAASKMDRCMKAGALALGANVKITTIPGYFPIKNDRWLGELFKESATRLVGRSSVSELGNSVGRGGSTDMGDLSQIMPVIHPYASGFTGLGHGRDYTVSDYDQALIYPAKAMAMTVIDLLTTQAEKAKEVLTKSGQLMTKARYLALQESVFSEDLYESF